MKIKKGDVYTLLLCVLSSIFFITVNSKNSFLYSFNNNVDVHCFLTSSKCMLRGDVMYRDVYEHRGTMNYFIYIVALLISRHSFIGIYIIELIFFSVFLFFASKTANSLIIGFKMRFMTILFTGFFASSFSSFDGGGESEEFTLPFLMLSVYIVVKHFRNSPDEKISFSKIASVGICFAVVFWIKYTITGIYIGIVLAVIIFCIMKKRYKDIFLYAVQFTAGVLIGSTPVLIYHAATRSFYDMVYVYFYTLIFKYSKYSSIPKTSIFFKLIYFFVPLLFITLGILLLSKGKKCTYVRFFGVFMLAGEVAGIICGKLHKYSYEPLMVFIPLSFAGLCFIVNEKIIFYDELPEKLKKVLDSFKNGCKKDKKKTEISLCVITALSLCILSVFVSYSFGYTKFKLEDYPQYRISRYILENSPDEPVIVNYHCLDQGIYWLTDTYPADKYYCSYNLDSDEINAMYEEYVGHKKADYAVLFTYYHGVPEAPPEGYEIVCFEEYPDNDLPDGNLCYELVKRID